MGVDVGKVPEVKWTDLQGNATMTILWAATTRHSHTGNLSGECCRLIFRALGGLRAQIAQVTACKQQREGNDWSNWKHWKNYQSPANALRLSQIWLVMETAG